MSPARRSPQSTTGTGSGGSAARRRQPRRSRVSRSPFSCRHGACFNRRRPQEASKETGAAVHLIAHVLGARAASEPVAGIFRAPDSEQRGSFACRRWWDFEVALVSIGAAIRLPVSCRRLIPAVGQEPPVACSRRMSAAESVAVDRWVAANRRRMQPSDIGAAVSNRQRDPRVPTEAHRDAAPSSAEAAGPMYQSSVTSCTARCRNSTAAYRCVLH